MSTPANYSDLFVEVQSKVKQACDPTVMLLALRRTARDFCQRSGVWNQDLPAINLTANAKVYTITDLGDECELLEILNVRVRSATQVTNGDRGQPQNLNNIDVDPSALTLTFKYAPSTAAITGGLVVAAKLAPLFNSDGFPAWIMRKWPYGLAAGAAWDIASNPANGSQYDEVAKEKNRTEYDRAINEAIRYSVTKGRNMSQVIRKGFRMMVRGAE